jgi:hypothetical protein
MAEIKCGGPCPFGGELIADTEIDPCSLRRNNIIRDSLLFGKVRWFGPLSSTLEQ